jgi:hypothetical protein
MIHSKEKTNCMQQKKASLNLMEFRYYGCSNNSINSIINHYYFTGGFYRTYYQEQEECRFTPCRTFGGATRANLV